jgi:hypothetical protein
MRSFIQNGINVGELTVLGLTNLTPELLAVAINEWQDPIIVAEYFHIENPILAVFAKPIFRENWEHVEFVLTDSEYLYNQITKDPLKKRILDTPRGIAWINYVKRRCHEYYFWYTWGKKCPRCAKDMERKKGKQARMITNEAYICKCGYILPIFDNCEPSPASTFAPTIAIPALPRIEKAVEKTKSNGNGNGDGKKIKEQKINAGDLRTTEAEKYISGKIIQ